MPKYLFVDSNNMAKALKNADRHIQNVEKMFTSKEWQDGQDRVGKFGVESIVRGSRIGTDADDGRFVSYSDKYAKRKAKTGQNFWLTLTGEGLGTIKNPKHFELSRDKKSVTITYSGPVYMIAHQEGATIRRTTTALRKGRKRRTTKTFQWKLPQRKWFGIGRTHTAAGIVKIIKQTMREVVAIANRGGTLR